MADKEKSDYKSISTEEKLKLTTYLAVSNACDDTGNDNNLFGKFTVSNEAKQLMTEFVWKKINEFTDDYHAFSQHAKRNAISHEDVKLRFRRNEKLLEKFAELDKEEEETKPGKKKKEDAEADD